VIAEVEGLVLPTAGPKGSQEQLLRDEAWEFVCHLGAALRLVLALRLGRLSAGAEWIHLDQPVSPDQWVLYVESAWEAVLALVDQTPMGQRRLGSSSTLE